MPVLLTIPVVLTSDQAEMVLFSLALRSKQAKLSTTRQDEALAVGQYLDKVFTAHFGWDGTIDRMKLMRHPLKSVNLRFYDLPPKEDI